MLEQNCEILAPEPLKEKTHFRLYPTREPAILALLSTFAVVCFGAVSGLSSIYHAQQKSLGTYWFNRGASDLKQHNFIHAATEFRTALLYSRDNYSYQLNLAEALLGQKRIEEASAYLNNLWEREPENGLVNLELARIAAGKQEPDQALRYYHNAIYATWPGDRETARRQARLELIAYLLKVGDKPQAQSELIALAANLGDDAARLTHIGDLFIQAQDYNDALASYRRALSVSRRNPAALAGAGHAAFELGRYRIAEQYLQSATTDRNADAEIAAQLETAGLVLRMDPFRPQIAAAQRDRIVMEAFNTAGERLLSCAALAPLAESWTKLKPQITERGLRRNPDLPGTAMELVFNIERQANPACGAATATDHALLLIARLHEGN
jgi:tetratricopeptide (TPR) repeat protein